MSPELLIFLIPTGLFGGLLLAVEIGYRLGARRRVPEDELAHLGAAQGAALGLLGLLLGFAFAGATSRFIDRGDIIVREANAIGTAYLRADLMDDRDRDALKALLREYTEHRLALFREIHAEPGAALARTIAADQIRIWSVAANAVRPAPHLAVPVLAPINEIFDAYAERNAATRRHLPTMVLVLLMACATLALGIVGYNGGLSARRRNATSITLAVLIAAALWVTIDMDYPRAGVVSLSDASLVDALIAMSPVEPSASAPSVSMPTAAAPR